MKLKLIRIGTAAMAAIALALAGCGGGGGGGASTDTGSATGTQAALASAAAQPSNDTAVNPAAAFSVLQAANVPAVDASAVPQKVNFAVFSDGKLKTDLTPANVSFVIAKLVPGTNDDPDQWVNYIYRTESTATGTAHTGPGGTPVLASAFQATSDTKLSGTSTAALTQLVLNPDGYYTYTFSSDITDSKRANANGVTFEPNRTHRIAIQLSYTNAAGELVRVNPSFDFTFDATRKSVPVTDPAKTRKMVDVGSCNGCHQKLALHGGGRVDTQFCVMCHNPGSTDAQSGNVLTFATMVHKIHAGKRLAAAGEDFAIWGFNNAKVDFSEVGFPQDLRNCTTCHSGANPKTPQGDNWKTKPSRQACLTCHDSRPGSDWYNIHFALNGNKDPNAPDTLLAINACAGCHRPGTAIAPERVHFNQAQTNAALYKMNIESAVYDAAARVVNVKYFLSNPASGNTAYNLVTSDCTGSGATLACSNTTKFGNLKLYLAYQNMVGQPLGVTEFSAYNNGGSGANIFAYQGTNDGSNHYTAKIAVPADVPGVSVAGGTARVVSIGQVKEPKLEAVSIADPRPAESPLTLINVGVQNTSLDFPLTGTLVPRRAVVATEKCNACHGFLGTASASNTVANAFHGGARSIVEACVVCHDPNKVSASVMTNGLNMNESYQFKRMIHGIHGNSKRTYPFTEGNKVIGQFDDAGTLLTPGSFQAGQSVTINGTPTVVIPAGTAVATGSTFQTIADMITAAARALGYTGAAIAPPENYGAEVAYPDETLNCNACHVDNSYQVDRGTLGGVVSKPAGVTDPMKWLVISPKAASCTSCHDSPKAIGHVTSFGNASYGNRTQAESMQIQEICADCHAGGGFKGVDIVHGLK